MKRVRALYSGNVQGVGFRFTAIDAAQKYGLTGWVRNTVDDKVELVAEGNESKLESFLSDVKKEMSHYIRKEDISWEPATGELPNFTIKF
jgi:acylphosphatase